MKLPFDGAIRRRIFLMRHAHAEYVRPDGTRAPDSRLVPLTAQGREEAVRMSRLLAEATFDRAICSGLPRTRETATIILGERTLPLEIVGDLEEIRGGDAIARARLSPVDYAYAMFRAAEPDACFANGEKFSEFADRVLPAFQGILDDSNWSSLLLVAHGGVNRAILSHVLGSGLASFGSLEQDSCCLNIIDFDATPVAGTVLRRIIRGLNLTADDPVKLSHPLTTLERMVGHLSGQSG
jgi:probable phosphoglycerate mutase